MMIEATIPRGQWHHDRHANREPAMGCRSNYHGRAHAALLVANGDAKVNQPNLPWCEP
jgi:hypothetical protein